VAFASVVGFDMQVLLLTTSLCLAEGKVCNQTSTSQGGGSQTELSFSSLVLAAVSSNDSAISQNNTDPHVQGLLLQAPPNGGASSSNATAATAAAWLASGSWLVPQALQQHAAACSTPGSPPAAAALTFLQHHVTMLVDPQSLAQIQQALCTAAAAAAIPSNLDVTQVRAAYMANDPGVQLGELKAGCFLTSHAASQW
jgi:hypothetical protein